ncbi:hypothetical protein pdam_00012799 [Pocillopora damicornis]|uniref:LIM zinc-binding domain-containing protein n=1 Tax=Pocillopora damicornis TaxID=46731 RepID=A0A3M6TJD3_POCDA|nr:hypothetical protein pdam_00012799 [Pocillopora damicornis]
MSASKLNNAVRSCAGCKKEIKEKYLLSAADKFWHTTCLKCTQCGVILEQVGKTCFEKGTSILCRNDYSRLYGSPNTCAACAKQISPTAKVLRSGQNIYHVNCFACITCKRLLKTGDTYYVIDGELFCKGDATMNNQQER